MTGIFSKFFDSSAQALEFCSRHLRNASESPVIQEGRGACFDFWKWAGNGLSKHWRQEVPPAWSEGSDWCHQTIADKTYLCHKQSRAFYKPYQPDWGAVACLQLGLSVIPVAISSSVYHLSMGVCEQCMAVLQIKSKYQEGKEKRDFNRARFVRLEVMRLIPSADGRCVKAVTSLAAGVATVFASLYGLYNPLDSKLTLLSIRERWLGRYKIPSKELQSKWETLSVCQTAIGYLNGSLSLYHAYGIEPLGYLRAAQKSSPPFRIPSSPEVSDSEEDDEGEKMAGEREPLLKEEGKRGGDGVALGSVLSEPLRQSVKEPGSQPGEIETGKDSDIDDEALVEI